MGFIVSIHVGERMLQVLLGCKMARRKSRWGFWVAIWVLTFIGGKLAVKLWIDGIFFWIGRGADTGPVDAEP